VLKIGDDGVRLAFRASQTQPPSPKISRRILSGDQGMIVWWSIGLASHVQPHSHANEQIVWMLKARWSSARWRTAGLRPRRRRGHSGGTEHEGWFHEDTEVIDFFAPPRDDFLVGGKPAYMSERA